MLGIEWSLPRTITPTRTPNVVLQVPLVDLKEFDWIIVLCVNSLRTQLATYPMIQLEFNLCVLGIFSTNTEFYSYILN